MTSTNKAKAYSINHTMTLKDNQDIEQQRTEISHQMNEFKMAKALWNIKSEMQSCSIRALAVSDSSEVRVHLQVVSGSAAGGLETACVTDDFSLLASVGRHEAVRTRLYIAFK